MSQAEMETEESGWTKANLQKLLAAMKASIPEGERMSAYTQGLKTLNWEKVAFPPFSPDECRQKWRDILQKMRKIRTLTELIVEAEDVISDPFPNKKIHPDFPKRPVPPHGIYYEENYSKIQKRHPEMSISNLFKVATKEYQVLPDEKKMQYVEKHKTASKEYKKKKLEFRKEYDKSYCEHKTKKRDSTTGESAIDDEGLPPKPPLSGYHLFCKEVTGQGDIPKKPYMSVWSQRWRDLSEKERSEYVTRCKQLKRQYATKLYEYLMRFDEGKRQQILHRNNIKMPKKCKILDRKTVKMLPGEPKMPSRSGNVIFCQNQMELLKDKIPKAKERFIVANKMWQNLSTKEKEQYKLKVHEKMKKYSMELQKWFKTLTAKEQQEYQTRNRSKCQYLDPKKMKVYDREELCLKQPSDSEDEDIEDSSSDEEDIIVNLAQEDEEEEEEDDDVMFEMY